MVSREGDKKRRYEPPRIYEMETDMSQAMGQSLCGNGNRAAGACNIGNRAAGECRSGNRATSSCASGSKGAPPPSPCQMGAIPTG